MNETDWRRVSAGKEAETRREENDVEEREGAEGEQTKNERFQMNRVITSVACWFLFSFSRRSFSPLRLLPMEELLMYSGARLVAPLLMEFPIFSFPSTRLCSPFPLRSIPRSLRSPTRSLLAPRLSSRRVDRLPNSFRLNVPLSSIYLFGSLSASPPTLPLPLPPPLPLFSRQPGVLIVG